MDEQRMPVVVGVGQLRANRERTVEGAREPLALLIEALRTAEGDAGVPGLLRRADAVHAVKVSSWAYDGLASRVAGAVGAPARTLVDTGLGGHLTVRLLDEAAARIWHGDSEVALVVGGEAQASVSLLAKAGVASADLGWSAAPGGPPSFDVEDLGSAGMQAAGLLAPTRVYPLFENRLQADLGLTPGEARAWSAELYSAYTEVAAGHPAAWSPTRLTPAEVADVTPSNRMVCEPYPLSMNAMPHVDQAAAVIVTSLATARSLGVTSYVHVWGGAGADDPGDILARASFGQSRAMALSLDRCLEQGGVTAADLDLVDVYSCFPVVPKLAGLHLGLPRGATLSVTGGHSAFGGPLNSYSLHAVATAVERLRSGGVGLVHANGGYLTYQHGVLLSSTPHPDGYVGRPEPVRVEHPDAPPTLLLSAEVDAVVETATVEHGRSGAPVQAFVVARTGAGERVATCTPRGDAATAALLSLDALPPGLTTHVGRPVRLSVSDGGATVSLR